MSKALIIGVAALALPASIVSAQTMFHSLDYGPYGWSYVAVSLARETDDPAVKRRYEALAVEFAQNIGGHSEAQRPPRELVGVTD